MEVSTEYRSGYSQFAVVVLSIIITAMMVVILVGNSIEFQQNLCPIFFSAQGCLALLKTLLIILLIGLLILN